VKLAILLSERLELRILVEVRLQSFLQPLEDLPERPGIRGDVMQAEIKAVQVRPEARERGLAETSVQLPGTVELGLYELLPFELGLVRGGQIHESPRARVRPDLHLGHAGPQRDPTAQNIGAPHDRLPGELEATFVDGPADQTAQALVVDRRVAVELLSHPHQELVLGEVFLRSFDRSACTEAA
jgi:hypothetical protein